MKANEVFNHVAPIVDALYARWADENQYEDWSDYEKVLQKYVESRGMVFVKATHSPFEVVFESVGEGKFKIKCKGNKIILYNVP